MFRWAAAQPLPPRLRELLDRADAASCPWDERTADVVIVFMPPHLLVEAGWLPHTALLASYTLTRGSYSETTTPATLINGERLLAYSAEELRDWSSDQPLPRAGDLQPVSVLHGAFTRALLDADPSLQEQYQWLDGHSLRGGAEPDLEYRARLACSDPESLVEAWHQIHGQRSADMHLEAARQQLISLEDEFEQYVLASRETANKLSWNREGRAQALQLLQQQSSLLQRLLTLQARMASCGSL
jgi:hypothetical protein